MYRGRFAPSPTGNLHLGSAACALLAWLEARSAGGRFVIRVEDLDTPRVRPGCEREQLDDLRWLGLDWDEGPDVGGPWGPYRQSERTSLYREALEGLERRGETYLCDCSRAEIGRAASAPHAGEEGPVYPGTCRSAPYRRAHKRPPAVRFRVPEYCVITANDRFQGSFTEQVARVAGDFVLRRADGIYAYQLAVVVDDLAMRITDVVRGADLLGSTARQILLARALGGSPPRYAHVPLIVGPDGARLAKRAHGISLRDYRGAGISPESVVGELAGALRVRVGHKATEAIRARDLLSLFDDGALAGCRAVHAPSGLLSRLAYRVTSPSPSQPNERPEQESKAAAHQEHDDDARDEVGRHEHRQPEK